MQKRLFQQEAEAWLEKLPGKSSPVQDGVEVAEEVYPTPVEEEEETIFKCTECGKYLIRNISWLAVKRSTLE